MVAYKLGKLPARKNSVALRLRDYLALTKLPNPPASAGHQNLADNNVFGNDEYGDCVCAGAGHETLLWNREAGKVVELTTANVLTMYTSLTGFDPNDPSTDNGTDMALAAKWRQRHGLVDNDGHAHKVAAYLAITPGNIHEIKQAIYLFGALGVGWELPSSAQEQFQAGKPWTVVRHADIEGGHYTSAVGYDPDYLYIITWGRVQPVAWEFFSKYNDEAIVYLSDEFLSAGKSPEGFNVKQLTQDLRAL